MQKYIQLIRPSYSIHEQTLTLLYQKCLVSLGKLPESAVYRKTTEPLIREKLAFVEAEKDIAELEKKLGYQVEESIKLVSSHWT